MLTAELLVKSFGDLRVLKGISLEVKKGEIVAIVGASGAGKTTLLQILGTLGKPDSGKVRINGKDIFSRENQIYPGSGIGKLVLSFSFTTSSLNSPPSRMSAFRDTLPEETGKRWKSVQENCSNSLN